MYFATSMIECSPFLPFFAALGISLVCSLGGISGGFMLLPFQISVLGINGVVVSPTNHLFNLVGCPAGVYRFWREGRLLLPLALALAAGTVPGVIVGSLIRIHYLQDIQAFKLFVGLVLGYIGLRMLLQWVKNPKRAVVRSQAKQDFRCHVLEVNFRHLEVEFNGQVYDLRLVPIFLSSLIVGVLGGIYGIGGGALMSPLLVAWFGLPVYIIAGATLMSTFLASGIGVLSYTYLALSQGNNIGPDWALGVLMGAGGCVGMYLGARLQKYLAHGILKFLLTLIILGTALRYLVG